MATTDYCPACSGHGTNVHECEEFESAIVPKSDLRFLLDRLGIYYVSDELTEVVDRLRECL